MICKSSNQIKYDNRHPLYLGDWKRSIPYKDYGFAKDNLDEPHLKRKINILREHPEIKTLYGTSLSTLWITLAAVVFQLAISYFVQNYVFSKIFFFAITYIIGASVTALFGVLIHETTHNLVSPNYLVNRLTELLTNTCIPFPIAASFRRYHLDHHAFQGVLGKDPDLPMEWEYKLIRGNPFLKFTYIFFYPVMYVVRGTTQMKPLSFWEIVNIIYVLSVDFVVFKFIGPKAFVYLFLSLLLGYGIHPGAAHFIQEHYTFDVDGQETYSYYGPLNTPYMNIGYHNEHHDFMQVPWKNLPKVKEMAPEFYEELAFHGSWVMTLTRFILEGYIGPQSRLCRTYENFLKGRKMISVTEKT